MTLESAYSLGPALAAIGPWQHYGFDAAHLSASLVLQGDGAVRYQVSCGREVAGAVAIRTPWLSGPYLQMLAVLPPFQRQLIGTCVLAWFEREAKGHFRNLWLCVTGTNTAAQRFYGAHGFELAATLNDLMRIGDDELLMRKRLPP